MSSWVSKVFSKRTLTAVGGVALGVAGVVTGNIALVGVGLTVTGWALPWVKELQLDAAARAVIEKSPRTAESDPAIQRLKRITGAPPFQGPER